MVGWHHNRHMSRDDRPNPNDNLYVEMRFIGSLWKETGGLGRKCPRKHLWDSVVGAKAKIRKLTILSNTFPKRGSWIKRDLSFYPDVCFAVFQIWETRNTNISQRYSRTSANGHLPTTATFQFSSRRTKNPYIDSCLKPLYNGHFVVRMVAVVERFDCIIW